MRYQQGFDGQEAALIELFTAVFAASEGAAEGQLIGTLVETLMGNSPADQITSFTAWDADTLTGGIFFTRLEYAADPRKVWLLAPVGVRTDRQGKGIGQALLRHGLDAMAAAGAEAAVTYGDPAYYGQVGFRPVSEADVPPPYPLSMPQGWQLCPLSGQEVEPLKGNSRCAPAFDDPALW